MKLNDYMAAGRPTVATAVGDVTGVIEAFQMGVTTKPSAEELAMKTSELLDNPSRMMELGRNARGAAETEFDWIKLSRRLIKFYEEKLKEHDRN